jgi:hypothetical protein
MKYKHNYGKNIRLFTDDNQEIGHLYPCDGFDPDSLAWIEIIDLKADAASIVESQRNHKS